jgi:dTDP-4-amino-4,6-dideoxygalactose transaminase
LIRSGAYILGPKVQEFENAIAAYTGCRHAIGMSSGTDALLASLMALGIRPGDLVITSPYSFFATAGVISRLNAVPVFVDIDPKTYNLCPNKLAEYLDKNRSKISQIKAVIVVHLYGQVADMSPILQITKLHHIPVLEDAAQSIGSKYDLSGNTKSAGSMAELGCFSFFPSKNLGGIGDGGMVVTNDDQLAEKLRLLRNHGAKPKYYHSIIGGNFRLDSIQAAVLLVKLKYLETWHSERQENARYYDENFVGCNITTPLIAYSRKYHTYNQYVILVPDNRNEFRDFLNSKEIGNEVYYPCPFHLQVCFQHLGYKNGDFPASEYAAEHTVALPIYPELTVEMKDYVISAVKEFYK